MEEDDALEVSVGRGGEIGANRYGVSLDVIKNFSSRSIDTFRPLCQKWHEVLGLASYGNKGQKRRTISSSNGSSVYKLPQQFDEGTAATMASDGIRGWGVAMNGLRERQ